jgi:uncharacterized protein YwgA
MRPTDFLLCLIDASGGTIEGRTLLQKRAFFVTELVGEDFGLKFDAHYYGPYSSTVEGTTTQLKNLGFLRESSTGFGILSDGFEVRRYDYALTEDGASLLRKLRGTPQYKSINEATRKMLAAGDPNYMELSIAAKAYFLLKKKEGIGMSVAELIKEAEKYSWNISPVSIKRAIGFLTSIGLTSEN